MGKRELVALLNVSSCFLVIAVWLFLTVRRVCLQFLIVVFPDHIHLLFLTLLPLSTLFCMELFMENMGISCETALDCHFIGIFGANLKRGHNDTNSSGKDKLIKAQLLSLHISIFKTFSTSINIAKV